MGVKIFSLNEIKPLWDLNNQYPHYVNCVEWDNVSSPRHNLQQCKLQFLKMYQNAFVKFNENINSKMMDAEEKNDILERNLLIQKRKNARDFLKQDLENVQNIDDLVNVKSLELDEFL